MSGTMNKGTLDKGSLVKTFGGGGSSPTPPTPTPQGEYFVKVIDYDGTVIDEQWLDDGAEYTLPENPDRTDKGLVFQEWSCSQAITNGKITIDKNNVMIGAIYTTASGQNEFDIELTKATGLSVTLKMNGTKDWGDGTTDTNKSHTYNDYGKYTIKCNGTSFDYTYSSSGTFGQSSSLNWYVKNIRIATASLTSSNTYCFAYCKSLETITFAKDLNMSSEKMLYNASLKAIVINKSTTTLKQYSFSNVYNLQYIVLPNTVTTIEASAFETDYCCIGFAIPNSVTSIGGSAFSNCRLPRESILVIPSSVTSIGGSAFANNNIKGVKILSNSLTEIPSSCFSNCYIGAEITLPNGIETINSYWIYQWSYVKKIVIPNSVTTIKNNFITSSNRYIEEIDFSSFDHIPTADSLIIPSDSSKLLKIKVPSALYDQWITETNWVTYADYIVAV